MPARELFEREMQAVLRYSQLALEAPTKAEITDLLALARRRLVDATKVADTPTAAAGEGE